MLHSALPVTWLTPEAHQRLRSELDALLAARGSQEESTERVAAEARIRQLVPLLKDVRLHSPEDDGIVEPGMLVEARIDGHLATFLMGSRELFGHHDLDVFSDKSPLGLAILGMKPGNTVSYTAPNGRHIPVSIMSAKPYTDPRTCKPQLPAGHLDTAG